MTMDEKLDLLLLNQQKMQDDNAEIRRDITEMRRDITKIQEDQVEMRKDITEMRRDITKIQEDQVEMRKDITKIQEDQVEMRKDISTLQETTDKIQNGFTALKMTLENETNFNIQLLAENHGNLIDKLNQAIPAVNKNLVMEVQFSSLRMRIEKLEKDMMDLKKEPIPA